MTQEKKVITTLNAINKNLTQTKFEYEFVKKEKWKIGPMA